MRHKTPEINLPKVSYKTIIFAALVLSLIGAGLNTKAAKALLPEDQLSLVQDSTSGLLNEPAIKETVNLILPTTKNSQTLTQPIFSSQAASRQTEGVSPPPASRQNAPSTMPSTEQSPKPSSALPTPFTTNPAFATLPLIKDSAYSSQLNKTRVGPVIANIDKNGGFRATLAGVLQPSKYGWKLFGVLWYWWVGASALMVVVLRYAFQKFGLLNLRIIAR